MTPPRPSQGRRRFLKGLLATAGAAAVAPKVLPELLQAAAPTVPELPMHKAAVFIPISQELFEDFEPVTWTIQREINRKYQEKLFQ